MTKQVAFLRAINVGGHNKIKMENLREIIAVRGMKNISTYIQSGNVLFEANGDKTEQLEKQIEKKLKSELGYEVATMIRTQEEMAEIVKSNPFPNITVSEEWQIYVCFLASEPDKEAYTALKKYNNDNEQYVLKGKNLYVLCDRLERVKIYFSNAFVEKKLSVQCTGRNWNTVNKILELMTK